MNAPLDIRHLVPVDSIKQRWMDNLLGPAIKACRFSRGAPGVDLAPLQGESGSFLGMVISSDYRRRVTLSSSCSLWRHLDIVRVYLHECAHVLINEHEREDKNKWTESHGPVFLLVQMTLFRRADLCGGYKSNITLDTNLYDFQDAPSSLTKRGVSEWKWRSLSLGFAMKHYRRLADSESGAEAIAGEAFDLWREELQSINADLEQENLEAAQAQKIRELERSCTFLNSKVEDLERQRDTSFSSFSWRFFILNPRVTACGIFCFWMVLSFGFALGYGR